MVDLYVCEPVSGGADALPHGQPLGAQITCDENISSYENNISLSEENI